MASGEKWGRGPEEGRPLQQPRAARQPGLPPRAGAGHAGHRRRRSGHRRLRGRRPPGLPPSSRRCSTPRPRACSEATAKQLLSADRWAHDLRLARLAGALPLHAHREHRGPGGRLHRAGRQDRAAPPRGGQARPAPGAGHDVRRRGRRARRRTWPSAASATSRSTRAAATTRPAPPPTRAVIRAQIAVYARAGLDPILWPRNAGSYPGYVFTGEPLKLPAAHFGLGHGSGAHAPDEYFVIESSNPKVAGWDRAVRSYVDYLYELATIG